MANTITPIVSGNLRSFLLIKLRSDDKATIPVKIVNIPYILPHARIVDSRQFMHIPIKCGQIIMVKLGYIIITTGTCYYFD